MGHQVDQFEQFDGTLSLSNNYTGSKYKTHTQSGDLTLGVGPDKAIHGWASVPIIASGDAINVPAEWILRGDAISTTDGDTNHIMVTWDGEYFHLANKVVAAP
ncbi:MAG: hypothetical protein WAU36_10375 [Cyclobacteriaceae bacterium]